MCKSPIHTLIQNVLQSESLKTMPYSGFKYEKKNACFNAKLYLHLFILILYLQVCNQEPWLFFLPRT